MQPRLLTLAALSLLLGAAAAAPSGLGGKGPVDIQVGTTGDVNMNTCNGVFNGGVTITQGAVRLQAQSIRVSGRLVAGSCDLNHFEATDKVFYITPQRTVKADKGIYDAATSTAVFTGASSTGVVVMEGRNIFTAPKVTVNMDTQLINTEGGTRMILYSEASYRAAGTGWSLATSAAALSLTRTGGAPIDVANPGMVVTDDVLSWTSGALKLTLTPGACTFGGQAYDYTAQVQAGSSSYTGCGGRKSGDAS